MYSGCLEYIMIRDFYFLYIIFSMLLLLFLEKCTFKILFCSIKCCHQF